MFVRRGVSSLCLASKFSFEVYGECIGTRSPASFEEPENVNRSSEPDWSEGFLIGGRQIVRFDPVQDFFWL